MRNLIVGFIALFSILSTSSNAASIELEAKNDGHQITLSAKVSPTSYEVGKPVDLYITCNLPNGQLVSLSDRDDWAEGLSPLVTDIPLSRVSVSNFYEAKLPGNRRAGKYIFSAVLVPNGVNPEERAKWIASTTAILQVSPTMSVLNTW